jgi:4-carboxymuconolactone decarboxylase
MSNGDDAQADANASRYDEGRRIRRHMLGDDYVERADATQNDWNRDLLRLVGDACWGGVWARPGLGLRERSLITVAMLAVMNRPSELRLHLRAAVRNGCTIDELKETLLQTMPYAGVPATVDAFRLGAEVLADDIAAASGS